jgi:hypothetical protein
MQAAAQKEGPGLKPTLIQGGLFVGLKPHANPERLFQQPLKARSADRREPGGPAGLGAFIGCK